MIDAVQAEVEEGRTNKDRAIKGRIEGSMTEETGARGEPEESQTAGGRHGSMVVADQEGDGGMVVCLECLNVCKGSGVDKKDEEQRGGNRGSFV